jgi:hypothetical protein
LRANGGELELGEEYWEQYPIADTSDQRRIARSANHILNATKRCRAWTSFPDNAVAIAGNGVGDHLVFLKHGAKVGPTVYAWFHETGKLVKVADDFSELKAL